MTALVAIALCNLLVASLIGILAIIAGSGSRRPALTHALWLLFFLKLITPPLISLPVFIAGDSSIPHWLPGPPLAETDAKPFEPENSQQPLPEPEVFGTAVVDDISSVAEAPVAFPGDTFAVVAENNLEISWLPIATGLWLAGSLVWIGVAFLRLVRFRWHLRFAAPAPEAISTQARDLARKLKVTCPAIQILPGAVAPMLLVMGWTPRILIPAGLLGRLDATQIQALLVHELAHWRRGDHWVRRLEMAALALYWWCPLVWWARRQMQEAEEECCDAWVLWVMPTEARRYALALLETMDFLAGAQVPLPQAASGIGRVRLLQRRLTMIMREKTPRALSLGGALAVLGLGALVLPLIPTWAQAPRAGSGQNNGALEEAIPAQETLPQLENPRPNKEMKGEQRELEAIQQEIRRAEMELYRARATLEQSKAQLQLRMQVLDRRMAEFNRAKHEARPVLATPIPVDSMNKAAEADFKRRDRNDDGFLNLEEMPNQLRAELNKWDSNRDNLINLDEYKAYYASRIQNAGGMPPGQTPALEQRLQQVERKLDMLLEIMRQRWFPKGPGAPGAGLPFDEKVQPPPPPPIDEKLQPAPPRPRAGSSQSPVAPQTTTPPRANGRPAESTPPAVPRGY